MQRSKNNSRCVLVAKNDTCICYVPLLKPTLEPTQFSIHKRQILTEWKERMAKQESDHGEVVNRMKTEIEEVCIVYISTMILRAITMPNIYWQA